MNKGSMPEKEKEEIRRLYTTTALSQAQIAKRTGRSRTTISGILRSTNMVLRPNGGRQ